MIGADGATQSGASEDGACAFLDGTICDDGDAETIDDICTEGVCQGSAPGGDTDVDTDTDTNADTDTDTNTDTKLNDAADDEEGDSGCGCGIVGGLGRLGLIGLFLDP